MSSGSLRWDCRIRNDVRVLVVTIHRQSRLLDDGWSRECRRPWRGSSRSVSSAAAHDCDLVARHRARSGHEPATHHVVKHRLRQQFFQLRVLIFQHLQTPRLSYVQTTELRLEIVNLWKVEPLIQCLRHTSAVAIPASCLSKSQCSALRRTCCCASSPDSFASDSTQNRSHFSGARYHLRRIRYATSAEE